MNVADLKITQSIKIGLFIFALSSCATNDSSENDSSESRQQTMIIAGGLNSEIYEGEISQEAFRRTIRGRLSYIKECYENAVKPFGNKDTTKIVARIEIHKNGEARNVRIIENSHQNSSEADKLGECITTVLSATKFPTPTTRKAVQVVYPFEFTFNPNK